MASDAAHAAKLLARIQQAAQPKPEPLKLNWSGRGNKRQGRLKGIGGSEWDDWNVAVVEQVAAAVVSSTDLAQRHEQAYGALNGVRGIGPKDEIEGMIAAQMVASHVAAMECYRRAALPQQSSEARQMNLAQANKLSRTYVTLVEALNRHRGKGQQKVVVEHVHVYRGGQAIVGAVTTGGGVQARIEEQAHAQAATHALEPALRGTDEGRPAVPVACDGQRPLPHARRRQPRRTKGEPQRLADGHAHGRGDQDEA